MRSVWVDRRHGQAGSGATPAAIAEPDLVVPDMATLADLVTSDPARAECGRLIVAHDLGTSGDKASLHDASGRLLASHTETYATDFGPGGHAEQDPADWWTAFCTATLTLLAEAGY